MNPLKSKEYCIRQSGSSCSPTLCGKGFLIFSLSSSPSPTHAPSGFRRPSLCSPGDCTKLLLIGDPPLQLKSHLISMAHVVTTVPLVPRLMLACSVARGIFLLLPWRTSCRSTNCLGYQYTQCTHVYMCAPTHIERFQTPWQREPPCNWEKLD